MKDEILGEIHETRRRIFDECGGDIERLEELDAMDKDRLVTFEQVQEHSRASKTKAR